MSDVPAKLPAAAPPEDKEAKILASILSEVEYAMRDRSSHLETLKELVYSAEDIADMELRAARMEGAYNIVACLSGLLERQKAKGNVFRDVEELLGAALSPFKKLAVQRRKAAS